ncbi:Defective in cullin neddylation protein [Aphelenchoides fujianensis]|nr:Defective in cullin neddylation protein [Aphelenchoides fujianensis]
MLEKPELIESFVGNNGLPESGGTGAKRAKDEITRRGKPMISANLDYYSSVDSGKAEEKAEETIPDHVDVEEVLPTTTPNGPPLPEISESIDELPMDYEGMTVEKTVDLPLPPAERAASSLPVFKLPAHFHLGFKCGWSTEEAEARRANTSSEPPAAVMSSKLKPQQKEKLRNFTTVTNSNEAVGLQCLQQSDWNLELAFDYYYNNPSLQEMSTSVDNKRIDALFHQYANNAADKKIMLDTKEARIGPNGMMRLLGDIHVRPDDIKALVLAWKCGAETQCEFTLDEWRRGWWTAWRKLRQVAAGWDDELNKNKQSLRSLYHFSFAYAKSAATKHLDIQSAIGYWQLFFTGREPRIRSWIEFVEHEKLKGVNKDLYFLLFDFFDSTDAFYANYDSAAAWPTTIDAFVEWEKSRQNR